MGWDDIQIEGLIKIHRKNLEKEMGNIENQFPLFKNPTEAAPVKTSEFLSHAHLEFPDPVLKEMLPRLERIKSKVYARVRLTRHSKYRRDGWYRPNETIEYELQFLYKRGEHEYAGAYFRNLQVNKYSGKK